MKKDRTPLRITILLALYIIIFALINCSCSFNDEPELDCYEAAKALEREQFEAYQDGMPVSEILKIKDKYEELYPGCIWD